MATQQGLCGGRSKEKEDSYVSWENGPGVLHARRHLCEIGTHLMSVSLIKQGTRKNDNIKDDAQGVKNAEDSD